MGLDQLAAISPDIPYRHFYTRIVGNDKSDFGPRLARLLDNLARIRAAVLNVSTTVVIDNGVLTRVAQLITQLDLQTIDLLRGNAPATDPLKLGGEELMGFPYPEGSRQDTA